MEHAELLLSLNGWKRYDFVLHEIIGLVYVSSSSFHVELKREPDALREKFSLPTLAGAGEVILRMAIPRQSNSIAIFSLWRKSVQKMKRKI